METEERSGRVPDVAQVILLSFRFNRSTTLSFHEYKSPQSLRFFLIKLKDVLIALSDAFIVWLETLFKGFA